MCVGKQPKLENKYEYIIFHITKAILQPIKDIWVYYERLMEPDGKPLGSDMLRGDVVVEGLLCFRNGIAISVKGQGRTGTTDRKIPHHIEYEVPHYPTDVKIVVFLGSHWRTEKGREFVDYAYEKANELDLLIFNSLDEFVDWLEDLASRESKLDGTGNRVAQPRLFEVNE